MSASSGSSKTPLVMIHRSMITGADEGCHVVCVEFKQARYPFKWRKYMCARCGALRGEHRTGKIRGEHLPPLKRLLLRYKWDEKALAAIAASAREKDKEDRELEEGEISWSHTPAREKDKEDRELEEGEISWSPGVTTTKGKRAPRRRRA